MLLYKQASDLPTKYLLKKSLVCKSLLDLADKVEPGMTKWRGQILFELQSASVILAQRAVDDGKMEKYKAMVSKYSGIKLFTLWYILRIHIAIHSFKVFFPSWALNRKYFLI